MARRRVPEAPAEVPVPKLAVKPDQWDRLELAGGIQLNEVLRQRCYEAMQAYVTWRVVTPRWPAVQAAIDAPLADVDVAAAELARALDALQQASPAQEAARQGLDREYRRTANIYPEMSRQTFGHHLIGLRAAVRRARERTHARRGRRNEPDRKRFAQAMREIHKSASGMRGQTAFIVEAARIAGYSMDATAVKNALR
jgi:hypothetical protein